MSLFKSGTFWFAILALALLIAGIVASVVFWQWLHPKDATTVSNSETLRNIGLLIGGVLAFVFALWRGWVAERQASTAQRQAETAHKTLLNDRYERGAEMLGSDVLEMRLAGVYALERLAAEHPYEYHLPIMKLFCAFVVQATQARREAELRDSLSPPRTTMDTQTIMFAICDRQEVGIRLEQNSEVYLELGSAYLRGFDLRSVDLAGANLANANLAEARLDEANLSSALLGGADLHGATLSSTNLSGAYFLLGRKNDEGVIDPNPAIGLTQSQLEQACADTENPPILLEAVDAETGHRLFWRGKPCED